MRPTSPSSAIPTPPRLSPSKYIGQTELGNTGSTSGGANEDFGLGKLDLYIDGPWASATMPANAADKANWASFPIPSQNGPNAAPVFAGGSDLAVFKTTKYPQAAWDLIQVMDSEPNSTTFANLQGFFPPYTAQLTVFTIPVMAFFLLLQRRLTTGLVAGAVKG